jgi:prolyl oligopeptidase
MRTVTPFVFAIAASAVLLPHVAAQPPAPPAGTAPALAYPPAPRGAVVEEHHGVKVADPYRWLEEMDSPATRRWVTAENALTDSYFARIRGRSALHDRIAALSRYESFRPPQQRGSRYFWVYRDGKKNQPVVYSATALTAEPQLLLDPNILSPDGKLAFAGLAISEDGTRIAYGLAQGGGDWQTWRLRDVATGKDLPEELPYIKYYQPVFSHDGTGVYYSRFPAPPAGKELVETDHDCKVYFHRIGTTTATDKVIYERPTQPSWQFELAGTRDGRYLVVSIGDGQVGDRGQEQIAYLDLSRPGAGVTTLIGTYEAEYVFLGNDGPRLYFQTTAGAPKKRIIAIDTRNPARDKWQEIIPQGPRALDGASLTGGQLFVTTLEDAHTAVAAYDLQGKKVRDVQLPGLGSAFGFRGGPAARQTFYAFTSFKDAGAIYRYDIPTGQSEPWKTPVVPFDAAALETTQVFFPSKDGTKVPMFLTAKKGLAHDGMRPTLLTAYGFGGVSLTPAFNPTMIAWIERGGIYGVVNVRGGGEYGEAWHTAAMRTHRQVGLDDFIAAGEWLIANHYTAPRHLGIFGSSGGGMLVGAVMMQRPELFGAAVPLVGVHDLLRFQLFGQGAGWQGDLGSPADPTEFRALQAISPLHNVRAGTRYPATLLVTSDHDVRVAPLHSYKLAAALQAAQAGPAPVLLRVHTASGHGGSAALSQRIDQQTELLAFFAHTLGLPLN